MTHGPKKPEPRLTDRDEILRDPLVREVIARALAPYVRLAPPALLQEMRALLEDYLITHPYPLGLVQQLRARAPVQESGEVPRADASPAAAAPSAAAAPHPAPRGPKAGDR